MGKLQKSKSSGSTILVMLIVFVIVLAGAALTSRWGKSDKTDTAASAGERLESLYKKIKVTTAEPIKGQIDLDPVDLASSLPEITKYPVYVENTTDTYVEIFSSPEKAGEGRDGWLNEVARDFNQAGIKVNGKTASVRIVNIASGTAKDYIISRKHIPDGFTPSSELWGEIVKAGGIPIERITPRLAGNVPGIVISNAKYEQLMQNYGAVNVKTITEAVANSELAMGYTDPFASSTGLNFLLTALHAFDSGNLLGEAAVRGFEQFQANVPFVASTTLQMREAATSGVLDAFVLEYQTFQNEAELKVTYKFVPFGVRHDNPLYAVGDISQDKKDILKAFAEFALRPEYQAKATEYGFNALDDYKPDVPMAEGEVIGAAQKLWKEKKNAGRPISAVFVTDVSGSMAGEPIRRMKESLLAGQKVLGRENRIGLVSYSSTVTINLPIAQYDTNQQSLFVGAVESLQEGGGTATFDAIVVAIKMLQEDLQQHPNNKPVIFVLSDGETTEGLSLSQVRDLIAEYQIPIYTIGYNANIEALKEISSINEAASINADTDDVVYKISNLLNVQM